MLYLKDISVSPRQLEKFTTLLANGPTLAVAMRDFDIEDCKIAVVVEKKTKNRALTIARLAGRMKTLLASKVDEEVMGFRP